jgi:cell wall-associated NlpC family hydrolase
METNGRFTSATPAPAKVSQVWIRQMRYQSTNEASGSGMKRLRRGGVALACAVALAAALGPAASGAAAASAASNGSPTAGTDSLGAFGETLEALATPQAEATLDAIGHGLALMEAQKQIVATERKLTAKEAEAEAEATMAAQEEVKNPSEMVPASAGTNGSVDPSKLKGKGGALFAHTRPGDTASTAILLSGIALAPPDAPEAVQQVINAANQIIGRPYIWGGGHASFYSYGYDCSGSVSFALHGAGLIPEPLTSGSLEGWGDAGPGKWITVYANAEHTFMEIAGLRFDTVGDERGTGPRWHLMPNSTAGFVARHPPGL